MADTEADTCRKQGIPLLLAAGWDEDLHSIAEQRAITDGRIVPARRGFIRKPTKRVDTLLRYRRDYPLALVEAKATLLAHIDLVVAEQPNSPDDRFRVAVHVVTRTAGSREPNVVPVKLGKGDGAVKVELTEDVLRQRWPHDYKQLTSMVKERVSGLKINKVSLTPRARLD